MGFLHFKNFSNLTNGSLKYSTAPSSPDFLSLVSKKGKLSLNQMNPAQVEAER